MDSPEASLREVQDGVTLDGPALVETTWSAPGGLLQQLLFRVGRGGSPRSGPASESMVVWNYAPKCALRPLVWADIGAIVADCCEEADFHRCSSNPDVFDADFR